MFLQKLLKSHYQEDIEAATLKRYSVSKVLVARLVGAVETARKDAQDLVGKMTSSDDFDVNAELKDHNKQIGEENLKLSNSFAEVQAKYHEQKAEVRRLLYAWSIFSLFNYSSLTPYVIS